MILNHLKWGTVTNEFNGKRDPKLPEPDFLGTRKKFNALVSVKKPTGDPNCPPNVKRAKRLNTKIQDKSHMEVMGTEQE